MGLKLCRLVPWGILLIGRSLPLFRFLISFNYFGWDFSFFCAAGALVVIAVFPVRSIPPICSEAHKAIYQCKQWKLDSAVFGQCYLHVWWYFSFELAPVRIKIISPQVPEVQYVPLSWFEITVITEWIYPQRLLLLPKFSLSACACLSLKREEFQILRIPEQHLLPNPVEWEQVEGANKRRSTAWRCPW